MTVMNVLKLYFKFRRSKKKKKKKKRKKKLYYKKNKKKKKIKLNIISYLKKIFFLNKYFKFLPISLKN